MLTLRWMLRKYVTRLECECDLAVSNIWTLISEMLLNNVYRLIALLPNGLQACSFYEISEQTGGA